MNNSNKGILDRENALEAVKPFRNSVDLLNDLLDYGICLLPRAFEKRWKDMKAICVIRVQLRQFLAHLDGAAALIATGNCFTSTLQLRSLLEIAVTLEWLLTSNTDSKVQYLYVANLRQRRRWNNLGIADSPEAAEPCELTRENRIIDAFLAKPPFAEIDASFQQGKGRREHDLPWYEVYGLQSKPKTTIRKICEELGLIRDYNNIYCVHSQVAHGCDLGENILVYENSTASPIRDPDEIPSVVYLAARLSVRLYRLIVKEYCASEKEHLEQKYLQDWEPRIPKEYEIVYVPVDTSI